ncbi:MerC domain-containing protein [Edaphobacter flagellatus]|uniref:MerC domain-containing protein n=1 Tax=Edaphobacter flagellatus TaxID=1933044 RepID=UPI0021B36730|nr:MerC domain-containing protein [Edaphobacter flagellatus]
MSEIQELWIENIDRVGIVASAACFVHCIAAPVLLSLSSVSSHFVPSDENTHRFLAVLVVSLGAIVLGLGYRRHKRRLVLGLLGLGMTFVCSAAYFGDRLPSHACEVAITLLGSCCMIFAHHKNHTFCRNCKRCT